MKTISRRCSVYICALAIAVSGLSGVTAQNALKPVGVPNGVFGAAALVPENFSGVAQQIGDSAFQFISQEESFDNRVVKGAPFSADISSESIQTLADGNRIIQRVAGHIYRDSQGRTRSERVYQMGGSSEQKQMITINDPVEGVNYILDPEKRMAYKRSLPQPPRALPGSTLANPNSPKTLTVSGGVLQGKAIKKIQPPYPPNARAAFVSGAVQVQVSINENGEVIEANAISGPELLRDATLEAARQWIFSPTELSGVPVKVQGILTFNFTLGDESPAPASIITKANKFSTNSEKLGKQTIEGVECDGARAVTTMPAGTIGNEHPIEAVSETWYSPEFQMTILSKRSDPRFSESSYRVTNLTRSEPGAELFQIPSDYTIIDKQVEADSKTIERILKLHEEDIQKSENSRKPNN